MATAVKIIKITERDADNRIDRWVKRAYPNVSQGLIEKLLRSSQLKVNGKKVKSSYRLQLNDELRLPPQVVLSNNADNPQRPRRSQDNVRELSQQERNMISDMIMHEHNDYIVINKPSGLASQGGSGIKNSVDSYLNAYDPENKYHLIHRLDRDTSGVMVLAKNAHTAKILSESFRKRHARKLYWALVYSTITPQKGRININIDTAVINGMEKMILADDKSSGKEARTRYATIQNIGSKLSWLGIEPMTGRKHQIRVHMTAMHSHIVGDFKYISDNDIYQTINLEYGNKLHLHARTLVFDDPNNKKKQLKFVAKLTGHMRNTFSQLGLEDHDESFSQLLDRECVFCPIA